MGSNLFSGIFSIFSLVVGASIITLLITRSGDTAKVISAATDSLTSISNSITGIGAAPVFGRGGF